MLVQFSVKNFKTFQEEAKLSMVANSDTTLESENIISVPDFSLRLTKSAVIYGANASGKSRLLEALQFMRTFVNSSSKQLQVNDKIDVDPFRLNTEAQQQPSKFEIVFIHEKEMFRYGFEATKGEIISEWLYKRQTTKEAELFFRERQNFEGVKSRIGKRLVKDDMIRPNALLLSAAAQFNDETAMKVLDWFDSLRVVSGLREEGLMPFTLTQISNPEKKPKILNMLRHADIMIDDISAQRLDPNSLPDEMPEPLRQFLLEKSKDSDHFIVGDVLTRHLVYDKDNQPQFGASETFSLADDESSGTSKFFAMSGPIIDSLEKGLIVAIDELDAKLHPNLVCKIVGLFNSPSSNPKNAQLIFNTHDTNLLSSGLFRRDQIWFTEKNRYGAASLYSLADFKTDVVRKGDDFEAKYVQGKFGAVPYLGNFEDLLTTTRNEADQ